MVACVAQNRAEYEVFEKYQSPLLARIIYADKDFHYLVSEAVLPCEKTDIEYVFDMPLYSTWVQHSEKIPIGNNQGDAYIGFDKYFPNLKEPNYGGASFFAIIGYIDRMGYDEYIDKYTKGNPWFEEFAALVQKADIKDFLSIENFGIVNRNGKPQIVLLDYGFNKDVAKKYYGKIIKNN